MFKFQIFFATRAILKIGEYLTMRPFALKGYRSIAHEVTPHGLIDPWPLRAKGLIALVSSNSSDRKGNSKVRNCKLRRYFGNKTKEKPANFATR